MDQIKKRLEIIKIAIFISDDETIKLQLLKLEYFPENQKLEQIIELLKKKNYGQAQTLIKSYLNEDDELDNELVDVNNEDEQNNSIIEEFELLKPSIQRDRGHLSKNSENSPKKIKKIASTYSVGYDEFELTSEEIEQIPAKKIIKHTTKIQD